MLKSFKQITFHSVFDATKGLKILRHAKPLDPQWQFRDHNMGRLTVYVEDHFIEILKYHKVGFWVTNI